MKAVCLAAALLCLASLSYGLGPTFFHKRLDPRVLRRLSDSRAVMLTFDDGPDPRYTGLLLDLLRRERVKATFFVVLSRADRHPELIERMLREGHSLALHGYEHKSALWRSPRALREDFAHSREVLQRRHWQVAYCRPPWGHFNLASMAAIRGLGLQPVTWSVMAQDWKSNTTGHAIYYKLLRRVAPGCIICLHDAGGAQDAPLRTQEALREALPALKMRGLHFVTADDLMQGDAYAEQTEKLA
jgi:peptidoglycan/xylan/chitin deacetylase (PgdA/CDA1 family)